MKKIFIGMLFVSQLVYGSPMPTKVEKACTTAEKSMLSVSLQGLAKLIDAANHDKVLGRLLLALAAIGAGYLVTRPFVWMQEYAHDAERLAEIETTEVKMNSLKAQLATQQELAQAYSGNNVLYEENLRKAQEEYTLLKAQHKLMAAELAKRQKEEAEREKSLVEYRLDRAQQEKDFAEYLLEEEKRKKTPMTLVPATDMVVLREQCANLLAANEKLAEGFNLLKQSVQVKKHEGDILLPLAVCLGLCDAQGKRLVDDNEANGMVKAFVESACRLSSVPSSSAAPEAGVYKKLSRSASESSLLVHNDQESEARYERSKNDLNALIVQHDPRRAVAHE